MEDNNKINENTEEIFRSVMFKSLQTVDPGISIEEDTGFLVISKETVERIRKERELRRKNNEYNT